MSISQPLRKRDHTLHKAFESNPSGLTFNQMEFQNVYFFSSDILTVSSCMIPFILFQKIRANSAFFLSKVIILQTAGLELMLEHSPRHLFFAFSSSIANMNWAPVCVGHYDRNGDMRNYIFFTLPIVSYPQELGSHLPVIELLQLLVLFLMASVNL